MRKDNVNAFCKVLITSPFQNFLQLVMNQGKFRGNFQKNRKFHKLLVLSSQKINVK